MLAGGRLHADTSADDYGREIAAWHADRVARLTAPGGWLSLVGLHFLQRGENTVGTAKKNAVVLAAGPANLGTVVLEESGRVMLRVTPGAGVLVDGKEVLSAELVPEGRGATTTVSAGTMSFYVIVRGEKYGLRVKDSESPRRKNFAGIACYPVDMSWRVTADWVPFPRPREVMIANILGQESPATILGKAVFERDGQRFELLPLQETLGEPLFFIIADATSGKETYGAARFVYADAPTDGRVVIDFNRAINPPCAFTPFATCPLPPKKNVLPIAVTAGEKDYAGEH
ncbi:MAG: DUF1684 domain-containing protein [Opitutaceae bacterium]|nr:DUF1684 domain-containing protein [Opitutaceae bacterium]